MSDTGAPWNIPYPIPNNRADDPKQSMDRAVKMHQDLDILQGRITDANTLITNLTSQVNALDAGIPARITSGITNFTMPRAWFGRAAAMVAPATWAQVPYDFDNWGTGAGYVSGGAWYCTAPGLYAVTSAMTFHVGQTTGVSGACYMDVQGSGVYVAGSGLNNYATVLNGTSLCWLNSGSQLYSRGQIFNKGTNNPLIDFVNVWLVRLSA
jgi:hypothetical protein